MKPSACLTPRAPVVCCRVAAHASLRVTPTALAALRRDPGPGAKDLLSASFLKHSEEQSVLGLAAVLRAVAAAGWDSGGFADWGVVAAANFFGRTGTVQAAQRFVQEGAWGISPHLIPHRSLHAISGTISQALKIYGPNFGGGGGPDSGPDAFLVGATLISDVRLPGVWLILTGHERESIPTPNGQPAETAPGLEAVALALVREPATTDGLSLRVGLGMAAGDDTAEFTLGSLVDELGGQRTPAARWRLGSSCWVELGRG